MYFSPLRVSYTHYSAHVEPQGSLRELRLSMAVTYTVEINRFVSEDISIPTANHHLTNDSRPETGPCDMPSEKTVQVR